MGKLKILVVDDESIVANDIQSSLIKMDFMVPTVVSTGEAALEEIEKEIPDLVLMDVMLKGNMDGIKTAIAIKENFDIPVIFLTAMADENTLHKAKFAEPYGYIIKPFREKDLQCSIEMAVYKHFKDAEIRKERDIMASVGNDNGGIFIHADYRLNRIKYEDIYFIEALKDYIIINTADNIYTTHITMKQMNKLLPKKDFCRIQRSYIVRLDKIFSIKYPDLVVEGKMKVIPIGGLFRKELYSRLNIV